MKHYYKKDSLKLFNSSLIYSLVFLLFMGFFLALSSNYVYALDASKVTYPVAELGNCNSQSECQSYCDNSNNMETCISYAEKNGMMAADEVAEARKVMPYLKRGETPGGCKSQKECDAYCEDDAHLTECIDFAVKAGFIDAKEAEMAKKTGGKGPGGCKRDECKAYCDKEENFPTCIEFAYSNGMMSKEEYEMAKKTGGKGPGNCKGKEECDAYCKSNELECMKWGMEKGLAPDMNEESKCMMECMVRLNVVCKPGPQESQPSGCQECGKECSKYYKGPCLKEEDFRAKEAECRSKGESFGIKPIMGDSGQEGRGECAVSIECFDYGGERGDNPGIGPGQGQYPEYDPSKGGPRPGSGPPSDESRECSGENCMPPLGMMPPQGREPGREGQMQQGEQMQPGTQQPQVEQAPSPSGDAGITGGVINEQENSGLISMIIEFLKNVFS
jgi:hypothetical protein